jgi:hypothetical protein
MALNVLRRRADVPPAGFTAPFGRTIAVLASMLSLALLTNASARELIQLAVAAGLGVGIYALWVGRRALYVGSHARQIEGDGPLAVGDRV